MSALQDFLDSFCASVDTVGLLVDKKCRLKVLVSFSGGVDNNPDNNPDNQTNRDSPTNVFVID
jgi:hypothetical protein